MKDYLIYTKGNLYAIKWDKGGELPQSLKGLYTSEKEAAFAADEYISTRRSRPGRPNEKSKSRAE